MITCRLAKEEDAKELAPRLRSADLQEIKAVTGEEPLKALERSLAWSDPGHAITDEVDKVVALFGVIPDSEEENMGCVWLLGSDDLVKHSVSFLRQSRKWVEKLHQRYDCLWNYIDARNEIHIRWLKWCGFTFLRRVEEYGVEQRPFYEFERKKWMN